MIPIIYILTLMFSGVLIGEGLQKSVWAETGAGFGLLFAILSYAFFSYLQTPKGK